MKKLIILLVIGSMFVFVSVQCALTNNNKVIYNSQYPMKDTGNITKAENTKSKLSVETKKTTTDNLKESENRNTILSD